MKTFLLFLWVFFVSAAYAQQTSDSVGLTGSIVNPDGSLFSGTLVIKLAMSGVKNICSTPYQNVPNSPVNLTISNGTIVNGIAASFLSNDCMAPRSSYYVQMEDSTGKVVFTDNWYLKQEPITYGWIWTEGTYGARVQDVGQLVDQLMNKPRGVAAGFAGPITVAIQQGVTTNPLGDQSIVEPPGHNLIVNNAICTGTCTGFGGGGGGGGSGTLSSIGIGGPEDIFSYSSPLTANGTLTFTELVQAPNSFWGGPAAGTSPANPAFRTLAAADIPNNNANTTGEAGSVPASGIIGIIGAGNIGPTSLANSGALQSSYFQGPWVKLQTYSQGQMVTFEGQTYVSIVNSNTGMTPNGDPLFWQSTGTQCGFVTCYGNYAQTPISVQELNTDTQITLPSLSGFNEAGGCFFTLDSVQEYECYTYALGPAGSPPNTLFNITRGLYGTIAVTHVAGTYLQAVNVFGPNNAPAMVETTYGYEASALLAINDPNPNSHASNAVLDINSGQNEIWVSSTGAIIQVSPFTLNQFTSPLQIGSNTVNNTIPAISNSGFVLQSNAANEAYQPLGFGGGVAGSVNVIYTPIIGPPSLFDASGGGSTTRSYMCSATDYDGNTIPGTTVTDTTSAATFGYPSSISLSCPYSAGVQSFQIYRTAGGPNTGLLGVISGQEGGLIYDYNNSASVPGALPPTANNSNPHISVQGLLHQFCDTSTTPNTCMVIGAGLPTGCGTTYGIGSTYGNESGSLSSLFYICSPPGTDYALGTNTYSSATVQSANYIVDTYATTGTNTGGYSVQSASVYIGSGGTSGDKIDVGIIAAPTALTQGTSWLCHSTYTETSTPPNTTVTLPLTGCGTLTPNTPYWVAYSTNDPAVNIGIYNCNSSCSGVAGSSSYGAHYVPQTYGTYTGLTTTLSGAQITQNNEFITVQSLANEWVNNGSGNNGTVTGGGGGIGGGVSSVGLSLPAFFTVSNSPVTTTGTLTAVMATGQTANSFLGSPNGTTGALGVRTLVPGDLPIGSSSQLGGLLCGTGTICSGGTITVVGSGALAFSAVTSATNTTAAMVCGTGCALSASGSGTISATSLNGNTYPASATFTQGGIAYATSSSAMAVSAALTQYAVVIGGGTGSAPSTISAATNINMALMATATSPAFRLLGINDWGPGDYAADSGAVNILVAALSPVPTALFTGMEVEVLPNHANTTTTPTLNINSLGAKTVSKYGVAALANGDLSTTAIADFIYDGTNWELQNPQTNAAGTPIFIHTISGATPTVVVNATAATDVDNLVMSTNVTSLTLPASTTVGDGEVLLVNVSQPNSSGPYTLPTGTAISPFTAGAGTSLVNTVSGGCPTIGVTTGGSTPSELFVTLHYRATLTEWEILGCQTTTAQQSVVEFALGGIGTGSEPTGTQVSGMQAVNSGHFAKLQIMNISGGSCTTAPAFNVYDGVSNVGTPATASTSIQGKGSATTITETQTFAAGDNIGVYISTAGSSCSATYIVTGTVGEP